MPTGDDNVTIPASVTSGRQLPVIPASQQQQTAYAKTLTINRSGSNVGTLTIQGATSSLVLGDGTTQTSTIDGKLVVGTHGEGYNSTLTIHGNHTIQGAGGEILMEKVAMIGEYTDCGSDSLTIKRSGGSPCDPYPDGLSCNVLLHGEGIIRVALDNRAFVRADYLGLNLEHRFKTGTSEGWWIVESGGTLNINCVIACACHWRMVHTQVENGELVNEPKMHLSGFGHVGSSGPFEFRNGLVLIKDGSFCTTGDIVWKSTVVQGGSLTTSPRFQVGNDVAASFGVNVCSLPVDTEPECE